jgi:short-subunit dehydrogenase
MGQLTTQDIGKVAAQTVEAAQHGRISVIPGVLNQVLHLIGRLLTPANMAKIIGRRWRTTHWRRLELTTAAKSSS